jgi:hypothetical protein
MRLGFPHYLLTAIPHAARRVRRDLLWGDGLRQRIARPDISNEESPMSKVTSKKRVASKKKVTSKTKATANPIPRLAPEWRLDMLMPLQIDSLTITSQQPNPAPIEGTLAFSGYVRSGDIYYPVSGEVYASDGDEFETIFFWAVGHDVFIFRGLAKSDTTLPHPSDLNQMWGRFHQAEFPPDHEDGNWTATSQGGQGDDDRHGKKPGGRRPR